MYDEPQVRKLDQQAYVAIRSTTTMEQLGSLIGKQLDTVLTYLKEKSIEPSGPPIIRYHICPTLPDKKEMLEVSIGWPTNIQIISNDVVKSDIIPEGKYVSLIYIGVDNGIDGNAKLITWAKEKGYQFDSWMVPNGEGFTSRFENMIDGPEDEPDPSKWRTEVLIKIK